MSRVKWDEAKLREYEESKPVRQKITEPKTPYHPMIDADIGSISPIQNSMGFIHNSAHAEAITRALNGVVSARERQFGEWTSSEDETDVLNPEDGDYVGGGCAISFKERRRGHYDEFRKLKDQNSIMGDELNDIAWKDIKIEDSGENMRTIDIEGDDEIVRDLEIFGS